MMNVVSGLTQCDIGMVVDSVSLLIYLFHISLVSLVDYQLL